MYRLLFQNRAIKDLAGIDKEIARRILSRLNWLVENIESLGREALVGDLSDYYKFRVGDYRVLYQVLDDKEIVVIHRMGHRSEIYRGK